MINTCINGIPLLNNSPNTHPTDQTSTDVEYDPI